MRLLLLAAAFALPPVSALAVDIAGARLPDSQQAEGRELALVGAGLRTRFMFKVYAAALYAVERPASAQAAIETTAPRRLVLHLLREVEADTLFGALHEGLRANTTEAQLPALAASEERLERIFRGIGRAREGDVIALDFGARGVAVAVNGEPRGEVADAAFARALLRVWLGEQPADAALKRALLGQPPG
ncbi:chalcone isomerase family protein [Derxia gummosa]|uniref:Chalcone isomerase family protein n=1 Tax=Derxia gummosa DSM 723 TaxID=1121388 RepID=A0A9U5G4V1_9BURK|nr:chalcone isomerase family protein [Derxia gummosa]